MANPPTITISPIPPVQGGTATLEYDGPTPASLTVEFEDEDGNKTSVDVTTNNAGKVVVDIPDNAESMKVTDNAGLAHAAVTQVVPQP